LTRGNVTLNRGQVRSCTGGEAAIYTVGDVTPGSVGSVGPFPASVPAGQAVVSGVRLGGKSPADHKVGKNSVDTTSHPNTCAGQKKQYAPNLAAVTIAGYMRGAATTAGGQVQDEVREHSN